MYDGGIMQEQTKKRSHLWRMLLSATLAILASGIVRALAIYVFVTPNEFAPGGINGIAVLLEAVTHVNSGYYLIALNVPLFFVAFFLLGKSEAVISTLSMLLTSGLLIVFDYIPGMTEIRYAPEYNAILASIAGGVLLGLALAIMLRSCGTSGGTTVLASLVNKKFRNLSVSAMTSAFDACVVLASFFVYHQGEPFTAKLDPVLLISRTGYSNLPVYEGRRMIGIVNNRRIIKALGGAVQSGVSVDEWLSETPVSDILSETDLLVYYKYLGKRNTLQDILTAFEENKKLLAVAVSEHGTPGERIVNFVTPADLVRISKLMEDYT